MGHKIAGHIETFAPGVSLPNPGTQVLFEEIVIPHPQAVTRQPRIHGVGAIGQGVAPILEGARGR